MKVTPRITIWPTIPILWLPSVISLEITPLLRVRSAPSLTIACLDKSQQMELSHWKKFELYHSIILPSIWKPWLTWPTSCLREILSAMVHTSPMPGIRPATLSSVPWIDWSMLHAELQDKLNLVQIWVKPITLFEHLVSNTQDCTATNTMPFRITLCLTLTFGHSGLLVTFGIASILWRTESSHCSGWNRKTVQETFNMYSNNLHNNKKEGTFIFNSKSCVEPRSFLEQSLWPKSDLPIWDRICRISQSLSFYTLLNIQAKSSKAPTLQSLWPL